jgi:hypothetical protein
LQFYFAEFPALQKMKNKEVPDFLLCKHSQHKVKEIIKDI